MKSRNRRRLSRLAILALPAFISCSGRLALGPNMTVGPERSTLGLPLTQIWKKQFMAGTARRPLFRGKSLLVPFLNGEVMALSVTDGSVLARKRFTDGSITGVTLSDSTVFVCLNPERRSVHAYDLNRGRTRWRRRLDTPMGAPAMAGKRLFVMAREGIFCLNSENGSTLWQADGRGEPGISPASALDFVVTAARDGSVACRQIDSGRHAWKRDLGPERLYANPVICDDRVFVSTLKGRVHALNIREGTPLWIWEQEGPIYARVSCDSTSLYVPTASGKVYRLNRADSREEWTFDAGQLINLEVAVSDSHVVTATNRGDIIVLSKDSGLEVWRTRVESRIIVPPVIDRGILVVADDKKWIYAFGPMGKS